MTSIAWRRRTSINIETALEGVVKRKICKDTIKAVRESGHWFSVRERAREEVRDRQPLQWEEPLPDENNPPYVRLQTPACVKEVQGQPKNLAHHWSAKLHRSFEGAFHLQRWVLDCAGDGSGARSIGVDDDVIPLTPARVSLPS